MSDSTPQFIGYTPVTRKLALGRDVNAAIDGLVGSLNAAIPGERHLGEQSLGLRHYMVKVTSAPDDYGAGKYKCDYYLDVKHKLLDPTEPLSDANIFDTSERRGEDGVFVNLFENNGSGHALTEDGDDFDTNVGIGWFIGWTDDDKPVFAGAMVRGKRCETPGG